MLPDAVLDALYVTVPSLRRSDHPEGVAVVNEVLGSSFVGHASALGALEYFRTPRTLREFLETQPTDFDVARFMGAFLVVNVDLLMVHPSDTPDGIGTRAKLSQALSGGDRRRFAIVGAPIDVTATGSPGARHGPELIRSAFRFPWYGRQAGPAASDVDTFFAGLAVQMGRGRGPVAAQRLIDVEMRRSYAVDTLAEVVDLGDVRLISGEALDTFGERLGLVVELLLKARVTPIVLGGDHSVTHFVFDALARHCPAFGVIHFDAHHDTWTRLFGRRTHANPLSTAIKSGSMKRLLQIGLRTVELVDPDELLYDERVSYVSAREAQRLEPEAIFRDLPRDIPYYLSFDVDCVASELAPETTTPAMGGLSYYQVIDLIDAAARTFELIGADFVEVARVGPSATNRAAAIVARGLFQLLLGGAPFDARFAHCSRS